MRGTVPYHIENITAKFTGMEVSLNMTTRKIKYGYQWDIWLEVLLLGDNTEGVKRRIHQQIVFSSVFNVDPDKLRSTVCSTAIHYIRKSSMGFILSPRMEDIVLPQNYTTLIDNGYSINFWHIWYECYGKNCA